MTAEVDLNDLSHSYPFLHLSRKFKVSYGQVLRAVDWFDDHSEEDKDIICSYWHGISCLTSAICAVCRAPWRWQFPPQGRGL